MEYPTFQDAEVRMPPYPRGCVELLRRNGHTVAVRINRNGSLRYRVDGSRELTAHQMVTRYREEGL